MEKNELNEVLKDVQALLDASSCCQEAKDAALAWKEALGTTEEKVKAQALLKELSIIHSGGAIKGFLANNTVLFNGEDEKRRGKKLRYGDVITIPSEELEITIVAPTTNEIEEHQKEVAEKARVAAIVKKMNQDNKKKQKAHPSKESNKTKRKPVRFPGT